MAINDSHRTITEWTDLSGDGARPDAGASVGCAAGRGGGGAGARADGGAQEACHATDKFLRAFESEQRLAADWSQWGLRSSTACRLHPTLPIDFSRATFFAPIAELIDLIPINSAVTCSI